MESRVNVHHELVEMNAASCDAGWEGCGEHVGQ